MIAPVPAVVIVWPCRIHRITLFQATSTPPDSVFHFALLFISQVGYYIRYLVFLLQGWAVMWSWFKYEPPAAVPSLGGKVHAISAIGRTAWGLRKQIECLYFCR